ncbi:MAG: metallophosphoesterase [Lachnospiraceae bacterium]|nr:metallophosphoesterase [Lachnospiraceae bacterium]MCI9185109.1 metallophosphoesterase [Lachnospiraceae bacterium]
MKILIVSDTHRKDDHLKQVIKEQAPFDMLIHLGDIEGSELEIGDWVDEGCQLQIVMGNNDFFSTLEREVELEVEGHRILLTHGHYYNVSLGPEWLYQEAEERGCDIAMYGHTHRPYLGKRGNVTLLNPGSLSYPRQEGRKPSYMMMYIKEDGSVCYEQHFIS